MIQAPLAKIAINSGMAPKQSNLIDCVWDGREDRRLSAFQKMRLTDISGATLSHLGQLAGQTRPDVRSVLWTRRKIASDGGPATSPEFWL